MSATPTVSGPDAPRARKDAVRNRAILLETADRLIAIRGLDVTFHQLAAAAGMGVGTVYRHFADREALLGALIEQRFDTAHDILSAAERISDPIEALRTAIVRTCEYHLSDRALWQAMMSATKRHQELARERLSPICTRIVERAIASGRLRDDFTAQDLPMIFLLTGGLSRNADVRPDLWRRYVESIIDGFMLDESDRVGAAVPAAPTDNEVERIMSCIE
ncbi:TetR/AcrR family transcriptional regulator [Parafrankia sp. EUN1f]|uniref:TetR/AcrR family transcriptional regulator n=1 Tax=Parafrankia sp. EUN1f TaxID=102897 RepID=UPI0001C45167|nr:TetR/AcrR family transcriptional regulator [Parafrankia sp. EUN1f]EFC84428.1 transcriptional regulator, TetR family [Parafrankia sp. EUN1f]